MSLLFWASQELEFIISLALLLKIKMSSYGVKLTKAYDLYRNSRVGIAMFDAIHELLEANLLNPQQALIIVTQFDFSIRRIMATKYSEQNLFSFEAEVKSYRLQPDWSVVLLENVAFYQHFPSQKIQLYRNQKDEASSSAMRISDKKYKEFLKK